MADTVTPKLGMTKPEIGASNNTWGTKLNGNFDILDGKVVYNTAQWSFTLGDGNPASSAGPLIITRYGNDGLRINDPLTINRQTGVIFAANGIALALVGAPPTPPAGQISLFADSYGNVMYIKPDGLVYFLGTPPGSIGWTAANSADTGWVLCNGQAISRVANPYLFARIGTTFGVGDGSTTFGIPDIKGRVIASPDQGAGRLVTAMSGAYGAVGGLDYHYLTAAQTPAHTHGFSGSNSTGGVSANHTHTTDGVPSIAGAFNNNGGGGGSFAAISSSGTTYTTNGNSVGHTHAFGVSGNTDNGAGLGSNYHPNLQPTICLYAQIRLG